MLFGNPELYERARLAKLGNSSLSGTLNEFRNWVSSRFSINVLYVVYDEIDIGPHEGRPRLNLVVETTDDYELIHKDLFSLKPNVKRSMLAGFARIVEASSEPEQFETENVHLVTDDFSRRAMDVAVEQFLRNDSKETKKRFRRALVGSAAQLPGR